MGDFLEAVVLLLPSDAGGRSRPIAPREGSYRPLIGSVQARFIEGPPTIEPGGCGRVVIELEAPLADESALAPGSELNIIEHDRVVGLLAVTRVLRNALVV